MTGLEESKWGGGEGAGTVNRGRDRKRDRSGKGVTRLCL